MLCCGVLLKAQRYIASASTVLVKYYCGITSSLYISLISIDVLFIYFAHYLSQMLTLKTLQNSLKMAKILIVFSKSKKCFGYNKLETWIKQY